MAQNMFSPNDAVPGRQYAPEKQAAPPVLFVPDYTDSQFTPPDYVAAFLIGFLVGAGVLFVFYKLPFLSLAGGLIVGIIHIFTAQQSAAQKRIMRLRTQFFDMLEAMAVAMRAGNPMLKALESAYSDLSLIYSEKSDIIVEMNIILRKFYNAVPLSVAFSDFAKRSGLEDVQSFASIYATIEGKSDRADEIIRETQQIIADKMAIEMEIDSLMNSAKMQVNIMLFMPLVILLVIGYAGAGFMDAIYEPGIGRVVATGGLITFIVSYLLAGRFSNVKI